MTTAVCRWFRTQRYRVAVRELSALSSTELRALGIAPSQINHLALEVSRNEAAYAHRPIIALTALAVLVAAWGISFSPALHERLTCEELGLEATRISNRAAELTGQQNGGRTTDIVDTTGGVVVVFRPALFFAGGDGASGAELARLKGEMGGVQSVAIRKKCPIEYRATGAKRA